MQIQANNIVLIVVLITAIFLIVAAFLLIYVNLYNERKKKHTEEKKTMQLEFAQQLLQSQLEVQEQTFNNISREIHDNVGQILSLAKVQLSIMGESNQPIDVLLPEIKENIGKAMSDLRDIAKSLSTDRIQQISFEETIRHETERINKSGVLQAYFKTEGIAKEIQEQKKLILFRIIQESLQNILKHAEASSIIILLKYKEDVIEITVQDDGKGFDIEEQTQNKTGLGLRNIISRTELIGGKTNINSELNKGTVVKLEIPYE
jgi:signal transduction histidine kinase